MEQSLEKELFAGVDDPPLTRQEERFRQDGRR